MATAFDHIIEAIVKSGFHNHRRAQHSDLLSKWVLTDILNASDKMRGHLHDGKIKVGYDMEVGKRQADLVICGTGHIGQLDPTRVRLAMENKSVVTAHRNKNERRRDMNAFTDAIQGVRKHAVTLGTIMIGTSQRVLNIPDGVKKVVSDEMFEREVLPRLSRGDQRLWEQFPRAIGQNRPNDPQTTVDYFREKLPVRDPRYTHEDGFDFLILVPVAINNVDRPYVDRDNDLGINVDAEYARFIATAVEAYEARF